MSKRLTMSTSLALACIIHMLIIATIPETDTIVSFNKPTNLFINLIILMLFVLPPILMSIYDNLSVRVASAIYQGLILFLLSLTIPFFVTDGHLFVVFIAFICVCIAITSISITLNHPIYRHSKRNHTN
ncbi:hypothetical protein [Staphylococcus massiliensis]|uniref:Putative integral inner membrane protein n=1 Tax=Staphylococcus massiliensis S46 TaxID=1229783 RepID=K9B328_9STAP|nr:hypothetical protein [Staphylococcus massiliensis]EKU48190.1 putative integral inner membrane protein [Staphylococcus massiliensis S46]MCG3399549.1 hypothetical protein [Staphylococcus massiliensis]MCG3402059.1 hypothetical protein [Staphylococcus massiliensis]MCG3412690.1 hypothetical protein [Staphylococcus massiliensis]POA01003.1 hypothetical protein CD133_03120 [Staphylococcus massiliensis CCUG 55927]